MFSTFLLHLERSILKDGINGFEHLTLGLPAINESAEGAVAGRTYVWTHGRLKSAPTGPSTSAEGRMSARTYVFEMERYDAPFGSGYNAANTNQL